MPVVRIPVQHKFGIVSLSRAEQLLARSSHRKEQKEKARYGRSPPSHELNQAFIIKYNCATESEREGLDTVILRVLHHAKYKAGLNDKGSSSSTPFADDADVDVSGAWLELTLLCQCYGQHQQDVLVTLATSLNHAQLSTAHIPSLFYIAGLCYQWLKSDILSSDLLRSGELLLLKILYLVSIRILYHHLTGALMDGCTRDEVRQLKFDLEGFENRERTYRNFPEALLHWKVALEIGLLVCETYSKTSLAHSVLSSSSTQSDEGAATTKDPKTNPQTTQHSHDRVLTSGGQSRSASAATEGHADISLSPILWHALDVWQCTNQGYESLREAMEDLLNCSTEFDTDNWVEGMLAMNILCTASETTLDILHLVQSLASGSARRYYLSEGRGTSESQEMPTSARECLTKHSASLTTTETGGQDTAMQFKKGTRFTLPASTDSHDSKKQLSGTRKKKSLKTLNILGMQPDFSESLAGSLRQTLTHSGTDTAMPSASKQSEEDTQGHQREESNCSDTLLQSVRTQSLIENESIPETPPSQYSSNTTILELGSSATLEPTMSMSKSARLLAGSNSYSKNLDLSMSNVPSTAILSSNPSGDIPAIGEEPDNSVSSIIPVQRKLVSPVSGLLADYGQPTKHTNEELSTLHEVASSQSSHQETRIKDTVPNPGLESQYTHYTHSSAPLSGGAGVPGSQAPPSTIYRRSTISTPATELHNLHSTTVLGNSSQFENWPNEVALVYTLNMASIVIFGRSSIIQKEALEGFEEGSVSEEDHSGIPQQKYGLMQLVEFSGEKESETDLAKHGFSWSIRHGAVLGLFRVCQVCSSLPMKDGLSEVAWSKLMERHTSENDGRVIEAYKVSKACPDLDQPLLSATSQSYSSPLFSHIADGLSRLFLPPITPAPDTLKLTQKKTKTRITKIPTKADTDIHIKNVQPKVVTHFEAKIECPDNFTSRTMGALNKIAEEHWKRQMQQEKKEEELARQKEELKLQKEYEEKMKRKAEKLAKRRPKQN